MPAKSDYRTSADRWPETGLEEINGDLLEADLSGAIRLRQECGLLPVLDSRGWFLLSHSTAGSQLGSMCECGRRTSSWIGLTPKVHGRDKAGVHSEYVENFAVR